MKKLSISKNTKKKDTITRTIRMSGETFDKIEQIAEKHNTTFNNIVNQILEYGLSNLDEKL